MAFARGVAAMRDGRYEEAAAAFVEAQKAAPGDPDSLMYLAELFGRLGKLDHAEKLFTAVSWSRPGDALVLAYLSQVRRRLGDTERGLEDLSRALALDPTRLWMTSLGYGRAPNQEAYAREREELARVCARRPDWGLARVTLGLAKAHSGSAPHEEIRGDFEAALSLDPKLTWSRAWLAEVCRAAGRHEEAVALLDAWLFERPDDADALLRRGESRAVTGPLSRALADFDRAVALRPRWSFALAWRGEIKLWAGDYEGALADCARAVESPQPFLWARCWRGGALAMLGRLREAEAELDAALREDPADAEAWVWRAETRLRLGRPAEAAADADRALSQRELLGGRLVRCLAREALGDARGAAEDLAAARRLGPRLFEAAAGARQALAASLGNRTVLPTLKAPGRALRLMRAAAGGGAPAKKPGSRK